MTATELGNIFCPFFTNKYSPASIRIANMSYMISFTAKGFFFWRATRLNGGDWLENDQTSQCLSIWS